MSPSKRFAPEPGHAAPHPGEAHAPGFASRLNWLRAGVLGANDGIVSTAGLVVGVAGATSSAGAILTAVLAIAAWQWRMGRASQGHVAAMQRA